MKTEKILLALAFSTLFLLSACRSGNDTLLLEQALQFAGSNRPELEKVLKYYSSPNDSLKYQAAVFLIKNMPYYYSYKSEKLKLYQKELYPTAIKKKCTGDEAFQMLVKKYGHLDSKEFQIVYDAHVITADYLIRNIEHAFKVWHEKTWGKHVSFDDFCEQILPYKIKNESVEDWREVYYNHFQPILDSLLTDQNDPVEAIRVLWNAMHASRWVYWETKPNGYPYPGAVSLLKDGLIGDCYEIANRAVYVMRALGIPGGIDGYLQFPYGNGHHLRNFIPDTLGNVWEFSMNTYLPRPAKREKPMLGRVFRQCFGIQSGSLPVITGGRKDLPPLLNNPFIKDVSEFYLHDLSLTVKANYWTKKDSILYLCTFGFDKWVPVAWTIRKDRRFTFDHVEKNMLYLPAYYKNGDLIPAGFPGYVNKYSVYTAFETDKKQKQDLFISRKHPLRSSWDENNIRIINGKFQADNDSAFSNPVTLHTIKQESDMRWTVY
jgi:hypothetical protein